MNELGQLKQAGIALSPEQRMLLAAKRPADLQPMVLTARVGAVDVARLRDAADQVIARHEVLRYEFGEVEGYRGLRQAPLAALSQLRVSVLDEGQGSATLSLEAPALMVDASSLRALLMQIASRYHDDADAEEPFQYGDYVEWRQDLDEDATSAAARSYWDAQLRGMASLSPPRLSMRSALTLQAPLQYSSAINSTLVSRVNQLAAASDCSAETVLLSVWSLLLAHLTGYEASVISWRHDCRLDYEPMQGGIGVYEKTLPVLASIVADESYAAWLARCINHVAQHIESQEGWTPEHAASSAALEIGFLYSAGQPSPWPVLRHPVSTGCELMLQLVWSDTEATLVLDATHYSQATLGRLAEQFLTLLNAVLEAPEAKVRDYQIIGSQEAAAQAAWQKRADFGVGSLPSHIAQWAQRTPDANAVLTDDISWSYAELMARANRLGHWMKSRGVSPGSLVALNLPRSPDMLVGILAAWSAGAAYLPLEPEWPAARRNSVLADARPALVLYATGWTESLSANEAVIDQIDLTPYDATPAQAPASGDALAYVLYTSGSTGQPKGVIITHGALHNYVRAVSDALDLYTIRRWALTSTVAADLGNTALFGALYHGATLVVASDAETRDGAAFSRFMRRYAIDGLKMVPSHLEALLDCAEPQLPRKLVLGGEAAPRSLIERLATLAPECAVYNHYGPTETTVGVLVHAVDPAAAQGEVLPLTEPLANNIVRVLDDNLRPVPAGAKGVVYVGGAQLCAGYLNRDAGDVFIDDPMSPGSRLYRTGDLAYVLPEGGIRLAGRADHQFKIRGYRIEPGEIEATLLNQNGIRQAVVLPTQDGQQLAAFLVGEQADMRTALARLLPAPMVPAHYTWLSEFPRLANGKIDRLALAAKLTSSDTTSVAPRDELETLLATCMAEVLGREQVSIHDDFFELGGHSLQVIKLVARIRKHLQLEVAAAVVFDHPNVAALANVLRNRINKETE
ncbi:amino acid adenylation domain-containing protein [Duganella sp. FT80W]|uniref:Amino acid adenylation domain-containing protein n=1 Tax=Duganella guangzhouensis TaxID=2666084 RepID=A0A6I2L6L0_9BURK|nr:amino acid adenylation domain-containing protein [Duganella guangzhouensis]MRW93282.1 amino acid adenylation domain-containing protein [Duganella guangzhouensis]